MTTMHRSRDGGTGLIATKGAIEAVLDATSTVAGRDGDRRLG